MADGPRWRCIFRLLVPFSTVLVTLAGPIGARLQPHFRPTVVYRQRPRERWTRPRQRVR
jgi:hypothetical protein